MADEAAMTNGVRDDQTATENFYDLHQGVNETKLKQNIEILEAEKLSLAHDNEEIKNQVKKFTAEIELLKSEEANLKLRIAELEKEVEQSEEVKRALESIAGRAAELETMVSRLQHDLISSMNEGDEANKEVVELKRVLGEKEVKVEEVKKEKAALEKKVRELERKIGVLEVKEIEEKSKKVRVEEEMREIIGEKERKINECKKRIDELESAVALKERLEVRLMESEGKVKDMEGKMVELVKKVEDGEKVIGGLKERTREVINGIEIESEEKGFKLQSTVVAMGSVGAIVAAAAVVYACYARGR